MSALDKAVLAAPGAGGPGEPDAPAAAAGRPGVWRRLLRRPFAVFALGGLALIVLACLIGPLLAPSPTATEAVNRFAGPSAAHWFGTDELGRDLLSRVLNGGRISLGIAAGATVVSMLLGVAWGFAAAITGRLGDELLMRLGDVAMALPQILLALVLVAAFGPNGPGLALIIGLLLAPTTARMARSAALQEISSDAYRAAVAYGASPWRLLRRELLPNTVAPLTVQATLNAANAIIAEASLSFVGLGIQPPDASWGTLLKEGYAQIYNTLDYALFPGLAIFLTIWLLTVLSDQLQDALDPRGARR